MVNKAILIGNIGKAPEIRNFDNGGAVTKFSVACTEKWRDKQSGEKREKTEWINVEIFRALPDFIGKGCTVYVEGKITTEEYDGKYYTKVRAQVVNLIKSPGDGNGGGQRSSSGGGSTGQASNAGRSSGAQGSLAGGQDDNWTASDDDIPF